MACYLTISRLKNTTLWIKSCFEEHQPRKFDKHGLILLLLQWVACEYRVFYTGTPLGPDLAQTSKREKVKQFEVEINTFARSWRKSTKMLNHFQVILLIFAACCLHLPTSRCCNWNKFISLFSKTLQRGWTTTCFGFRSTVYRGWI